MFPIEQDFKDLTENTTPQIVDLNLVTKILIEHKASFKIQLLNINNLELNFATPDSKVSFLEALFSIHSLKVLKLTSCNIFSPSTSTPLCKSIAELAACSPIDFICGLGLEKTLPELFGVFIQTFMARFIKKLETVKAGLEILSASNPVSGIKTIGLSGGTDFNHEYYGHLMGHCEIIIGESRLRLIGLNAFSARHRAAFFSEILKAKVQLKALYLYNVDLFFFNQHPWNLNHDEAIQLIQKISESGVERVAFWAEQYIYRKFAAVLNSLDLDVIKNTLVLITKIYRMLGQNHHLLGTDMLEDVCHGILRGSINFSMQDRLPKESTEFIEAAQALITRIEKNWNSRITDAIVEAQPVFPRPVASLTAQYAGFRKNYKDPSKTIPELLKGYSRSANDR